MDLMELMMEVEKAPAALCRKVIIAKKDNKNKIEVWGDGKQTRTFLYVDDCIEGTLRLFQLTIQNLLILEVTSRFQLIK